MHADRSYIMQARKTSEFPDTLYTGKKLLVFSVTSLWRWNFRQKNHLSCPEHLERKRKKTHEPKQFKLAESWISSQMFSELAKDFFPKLWKTFGTIKSNRQKFNGHFDLVLGGFSEAFQKLLEHFDIQQNLDLFQSCENFLPSKTS